MVVDMLKIQANYESFLGLYKQQQMVGVMRLSFQSVSWCCVTPPSIAELLLGIMVEKGLQYDVDNKFNLNCKSSSERDSKENIS